MSSMGHSEEVLMYVQVDAMYISQSNYVDRHVQVLQLNVVRAVSACMQQTHIFISQSMLDH